MPSKRQLFLKHVAQTSEYPLMLEPERAEGIYIFDKTGKKYIDIISGIGVSSLGHGHPKVLEAIKKQSEKYLHTMVYGEHVQSPQVMLAKKLSDNLPSNLDSVYFVNSGSEAVEGAMKLAKRYTERYELISCKNAYHGSTQGANSLMNNQYFTRGYVPLLPGIKHIEFNKVSDLEKITTATAGIIVETVQGEAGIIVPKNDYLKKLRNKCNETGTLLIFDEIQAGYGRTGSLFAFEQYGVIPDVLLLAKAMGGGMPIGAFVTSNEIMKVLSHNPILGHITTFGGHPVSCAAGIATLDVLLHSELIEKVKERENLFKKLLKHPSIKEIRSAGLMMAVDLDDGDAVQRLSAKCFQNGLLTDWFLFNEKSFRIAPPLIITNEEIEKSCEIILECLEDT